ncbi:NAD(P)-dependent dehydrogenase (short-subunit alcohol dehydrogenase family) [Pedobacter sp. CAN_A7]|uniref:SDR family NAD(P)-dependent oxidoreductase n=1 Tax=Pedobacter sp. CAN_A7 TaxID=2787722 RepID=UPI0018C905F5
MMKEECQVAIVTGAAGGIGRAIADKFTNEGYAVVWVDIDCSQIERRRSLLENAESHHLFLEGNLEDINFLQAIVDQSMAKWGQIDVLVNNAAWRKPESLTHTSLEDWNRTLAVNITAPAFLSKFVAKALLLNKKNCVFVNMSSIMAQMVSGYATAYTVCKGAVESLTYELATLYGPHGFRSVALRPGSVTTSLSNDYTDPDGENISHAILTEIEGRTPLGRSANPKEIAEAVFWLSSPQASFITATTLDIDGGLLRNFNSYALKKRLKPNEF